MLQRALLLVFTGLLAGLILSAVEPGPVSAAVKVPRGFVEEAVVDVDAPIALAFTPDGRLLVSTKDGRLRVYDEGTDTSATALDISGRVCSNSERGLLGVAPDPDFAANGYVYLYYTYKKHGVCPDHQPARNDNPVNRISRFTMTGDTVDPDSETVLIDDIPSPNGNHNGGDLHFGRDGYLYASVGDGACDYAQPTRCQPDNDASRDRHVLLGKVLRITRDGGIPPDNPFTGENSARCDEGRVAPGKVCRETFAMGLRNPFRMAFDPDAPGTQFRVNDVGAASFEEVNVGERGADYGWNCREAFRVNSKTGKCNPTPRGLDYPIHRYSHSSGCSSITGGAFVPDGLWGARDDAYLFGDFACGRIFELSRKAGGGYAARLFARGLGQGAPVSMTFGPFGDTQALYYTTFNGGGQVRRIALAGTNNDPVAVAGTAGANYSAPPSTTIEFSGSESSDPDGDALEYEWDFTGDGTYDARGVTATHAYASPGKYTATLKVTDGRDGSSTDTVDVFPGNTPPEPTIESPAGAYRFAVGDEVALAGSATDAEDDAPPELSWEVLRHHQAPNAHVHPFGSFAGATATLTAPPPEDAFSTDPAGNYLELRLTATDSMGLSKTISRRLEPKTVDVTFATAPAGLRLVVNARTVRGPFTLTSWEGYTLNVTAPAQSRNGVEYAFASWSDGGGRSHAITTPATPVTYEATFRRR